MAGKELTTSNVSASPMQQTALDRNRVTSSDRLLRSIVTAGDVLPWEWDIARDCFRWGASPGWLLGPVGLGMAAHPDLRAIVHPDDRERFLAAGREVKEQLGLFQLEFRIMLSGGATRNVIARGHSYAETGAKPTHVIGVIIDIKQRTREDYAVDELALQQRALLDSLPDVAWLKDAKGRLIAVNLAFSKRYGISAEAAVGKTDFDIYPRDKAAKLRQEDAEVMSSRLPSRYESSQEFEGRSCWVEVVKAPIFDADGNVIGTVGTARDVSARKVAERGVQESERRFRMLAEMSSDWYWEQDAEFRFTSVASRFNNVLDFKGVIGKQRWETAAEDVTAEQWSAHRAIHEAHLPFHDFEYTAVQPNGTRRRFLISGKPVYDENGKFTGYRGVGSDITERKAMETSLRLALNRSEVILQTTPTAIALVRDRVIMRCNPAMERLFGAEPGALVGSSTRVLFATDEEWRTFGEKYNAPVSRGEIYTDEFELIRFSGEAFWAVVAGRQIEPGLPELLFTYTDVTAQQNLARALATARELADAASQAKSTFLATMSHEIRTPMNGVLGMLELLNFTKLDSQQRETLALARESAGALLRLIDDILDFSKIEAGQFEIRPEPVSLSALATRAATVYTELASRSGLLLECHIDPRIAQAHVADGLRVTQIVNNLLSNAIKFTSQGKVSLDVESAERGSQEELVRLRVTDTGIGIPAEQQGRLFQPFVQADSDTTRNFGGSGLGLSICRRLAEMMGGTITLQSEPNIGTTMTVLLRLPIADPALIDSRDSARREQRFALNESRSPANPVDAKILIADDHPVNLKLIQRQASMLGYQTDVARDGVEALEKWKTGRYALLLSDCHMPRMDGYQLAREIRRLEMANGVAKPIPIVACTANALASDAALCFEAGMSDHLTKPITLAALKSKLEYWIVTDANSKADETAGEILSVSIAAGSALQASRADRNDAPLDSHTLAEFTDGDDMVRRELLQAFLVENETDVGELRSILVGENVAAIARSAHRIKGASRMIGAQSYADVTERIERAARAQNQTAIRECIEEFDREHARLVTYLRAEISDAQNVPDDNGDG